MFEVSWTQNEQRCRTNWSTLEGARNWADYLENKGNCTNITLHIYNIERDCMVIERC